MNLKETTLQSHPALLGLSSLHSSIPWHSTKEILEDAKVYSLVVQGSDLLPELLTAPRSLKSTALWSLQPRLPSSFTFTSSSLLVRTGSSAAPLLVGSSLAWRRQLSSVYVRNLLDCLCPAVLSLHLWHLLLLGWSVFQFDWKKKKKETHPYVIVVYSGARWWECWGGEELYKAPWAISMCISLFHSKY